MQTQDWSTTALGPVEYWPEGLKTATRIMLATPSPAFIWWGRDLTHLHNDACAKLLGRGRSIGRPASEIRRDIWDAMGPEVCDALEANTALTVTERRIVASRPGREREIFCSFTLVPIRDEWGSAGGVLGIGDDVTAAVVSRQRLASLRSLKDIGKAESVKTACEWAAAAVASDVRDIPFALVYLVEPDEAHAFLAGAAGAVPPEVESTVSRHVGFGKWLLDGNAAPGGLRRLDAEPPLSSADAAGVVALPLGRPSAPNGYLVVALGKRRPLDAEFRDFLTAAAGIIATGIAAAARGDAARALENEEARRNEFLAMLAHELRNPLAPIRSATELLAYVDSNPMSLAHARAIIERQLSQLVRLVDDLLDASRISRGTLELKRGPLDLRSAIANAVESVRPLIDSARHDLKVQLPESPVRVHGDLVRMTQVVANLLTNAVQFTNPGGRIQVNLETSGAEARIRVTDNGIGIDEPLLNRVFEMFTQGEQRPGEPRHGLGIGLAVARRLVELHGGTIRVTSAGPNQGSEFLLTFPVIAADGSVEHASGRESPASGRRILVADDNADAAAAMAEILGVIGHDVRTAEDGLQAIEIAECFRPDLILLDIGMPRLDGYETCKRLRQRAWGRDIPIYAVTGWGQPSDRRRTREAGFNAHLVKPVSIEAIKELIARSDHRQTRTHT
jgi:signal transduction histidine kinase/ActR/RegA family two-component response regulator